jgi:hypothetical protein
MAGILSTLSKPDQLTLLDDLNYLNMHEIMAFCKKHSIPYSIWIETLDGNRRKTKDDDRKGVILERIRHYLRTGKVLDVTCFPANVVCFDELPEGLKPTDRLFYGQYDKSSIAMVSLLKKLTGGRFKSGAAARILAREFWTKGIAPTFQEFAASWLAAAQNHAQPNPEWAFLSDRNKRKDTSNWQQLRASTAKRVLRILSAIPGRQRGRP